MEVVGGGSSRNLKIRVLRAREEGGGFYLLSPIYDCVWWGADDHRRAMATGNLSTGGKRERENEVRTEGWKEGRK